MSNWRMNAVGDEIFPLAKFPVVPRLSRWFGYFGSNEIG